MFLMPRGRAVHAAARAGGYIDFLNTPLHVYSASATLG